MKKIYCRPVVKTVHYMSAHMFLSGSGGSDGNDKDGILLSTQVCTRRADYMDEEEEVVSAGRVWFDD